MIKVLASMTGLDVSSQAGMPTEIPVKSLESSLPIDTKDVQTELNCLERCGPVFYTSHLSADHTLYYCHDPIFNSELRVALTSSLDAEIIPPFLPCSHAFLPTMTDRLPQRHQDTLMITFSVIFRQSTPSGGQVTTSVSSP